MTPRVFRVRRVVRETTDTRTVHLESPGRETRFGFDPGQFNMLYAFGVGEAPISISGDPDSPGVLVHTIRAVGNVTDTLCTARRGDLIGVRGPYGRPWPLEAARGQDVVFVGGGIGLAPLRPAVYRVFSERGRYGRVVVLYGARRPADILFREELERWRGRFDAEVVVTVDAAEAGWFGRVGVVTDLVSRAGFDPPSTVAFVCGPELMVRYAIRALTWRGVPIDAVWLSLERNMRCGLGLCGHCQLGPHFVCENGPVFRADEVADLIRMREL